MPLLYVWCADADRQAGFVVRSVPASNPGFVEMGTYSIEKPGRGWSLRIDDEVMADATETDQVAWSWTPGFFAGEVTAELIRPDGRLAARYLLDVSPDPGKLGRALYATMVQELWEADPALVIGAEPATMATGTLGPREDLWLAFWRLRQYGPQALAALAHIRTRPRRALIPRRYLLPARRIRTIDRQTARSAMRNPDAIAFFSGHSTPEGANIWLDCPRVETTLDTAANRCLFLLFRALRQRTRALLPQLRMLVEKEGQSETRTPLANRWSTRRQLLVDLDRDIRAELKKSPFSEVTRAEISAAGLNAIAADPAYARAHNLAWRALRHGVSGPPTEERLWMSPSWEIYERWCFVAVGRLLQRALPTYKWKQIFSARRRLLRGTSPDGTRLLHLRLQPTFPANSALQPTRRWSVSKQRVPDIVLTQERGDGTRFWVFDAKYRTSRANVLDAMTSAHIYQDSLRMRDRRAEATWLIVPRGGGAPWLEAPDFQIAQRVGVHVLAPGEQATLPTGLAQALGA